MFTILIWIVFGFIVGGIARFLHPGEEPSGCFWTIGTGIIGSFIGGALNWFFFGGTDLISSSGFFMSIIGAIVFCAVYALSQNYWNKPTND